MLVRRGRNDQARGIASWGAFPRAPRAAATVGCAVWISLGLGVLWGQLAIFDDRLLGDAWRGAAWELGNLGLLRFTPLLLLALCAYMGREAWRGAQAAGEIAKLTVVPRPTASPETYR